MSSNQDNVTNSATEHWVGRVKWFNNKTGYGFITITDGLRSGLDIFVHHSVINVENQQYKYLIQGEYVEFDLVKVESSKHEWQASNVSGINGGKLMCETRHELKTARNEYKVSRTTTEVETRTQKNDANPPKRTQPTQTQTTVDKKENTRQRKNVRPRTTNEGGEWTLAGKKNRKIVSQKETSTKSK